MELKKLFVPYELAVKLKKSGFDEQVLAYYSLSTQEFFLVPGMSEEEVNKYYKRLKAPLYQQIVDWLIEKHGIYVYAYLDSSKEYFVPGYSKMEKFSDSSEWYGKKGFESRYEALSQAIDESIKLIK